MENKPLACFEITSNSIKMLIGYELNGKPIALYSEKVPLKPGTIKQGVVADPNALVAALNSLHEIVDEKEKIKMTIGQLYLVIPPLGLKVYQSEKNTLVVADNGAIEELDVSNLISLVKKEAIPGGNTIVDIIPTVFQLADGQRYANPPLGQTSRSISVRAMIHTLPESSANLYQTLANSAGYRVRKAAISVYCASTYFKSIKNLPASYILVDIGAESTDVAIIGEGVPYAATSFFQGGKDLTEAIAKGFNVASDVAEEIKIRHGYDPREISYRPAICHSYGPDGQPVSYLQKDLNKLIEGFFASYNASLTNALDTVVSRQAAQFAGLPVLVTGGGSELFGIEGFLHNAFSGRDLYFPRPDVIGARDPGLVNLLGLVLAGSRYTGSLEDNYRGMAAISRTSEAKKPNKRREKSGSAEDDAL